MTGETWPAHRIVARFRGIANLVLLLSAITFTIAWAMHWPPGLIAPVGLVLITALLASIVAIVIENRITPDQEEQP